MPRTMRSRILAAGAVAVGLAAGMVAIASGESAETREARARAVVAHAKLMDANGRRVGRVVMRRSRGQVVVSGRVAGLAPGFHGFHVHAVGRCDPRATDAAGNPAPFASAGGHFNPTSAAHGAHAGDMPSLLVNRDGTASARFTTDRFGVRSLFDADGSAVIVHAGPDNFANIPPRYRAADAPAPGPDQTTRDTGDSGGRAACGVITRR